MVSGRKQGADGLGAGSWTREAVEDGSGGGLPSPRACPDHPCSRRGGGGLYSRAALPGPLILPCPPSWRLRSPCAGAAAFSGCVPCAGVRRKCCGLCPEHLVALGLG